MRVAVVIWSLLALGCADDPSGVQLDQVVGTWRAESAEYQRQDDPAQRIDVLTLGPEWYWELAVDPDHAYTVTLCNPLGCDAVTGNATVIGDTLILADDTGFGDYARAHVRLDRSTLRLRWMSSVACGLFDWSGPPCPISVLLTIRAERQSMGDGG